MEQEQPKFRSPESKQVSERTYEQYLDKLHIPEEYLKNRGIIVDIGAGFANFVREVNKRFRENGTRAYALDPVYTFFDGDFEKFDKSLEGKVIITLPALIKTCPSEMKVLIWLLEITVFFDLIIEK